MGFLNRISLVCVITRAIVRFMARCLFVTPLSGAETQNFGVYMGSINHKTPRKVHYDAPKKPVQGRGAALRSANGIRRLESQTNAYSHGVGIALKSLVSRMLASNETAKITNIFVYLAV